MKILIVALLLTTQSVYASYTRCPDHILKNKNYLMAISILNAIDTRMNLGQCKIELHTCLVSKSPIDDDIVGDLLVTDKDGKQQYITLFFPKENSSTTKNKINVTPLKFDYQYSDKNPDHIDGYKQKAKFNIELDAWTRKPKKLTIETYSSNDHDRILGLIPAPYFTTCE